MSAGVERTKRVGGENNATFIKFNYMEETSNFDMEPSGGAEFWGY